MNIEDLAPRTPRPSTIFWNVTWLTVASLAVKPLSFLFFTLLCMRVLGPAGYGLFSASLSFMTIFAFLADLGTGTYSVREIARNLNHAPTYFSNVLILRFGLSIVAIGLALLIGYILRYDHIAILTLAAAALYTLPLRMTEFFRSIYRAFEVLHYEAILLFLEKLIVIAGGSLLLFQSRTAVGTLLGMSIGMVLASTINFVWIHQKIAPLSLPTVNKPLAWSILKASFPLGLQALFTQILLQGGIIVLKVYQADAAAGQFASVYRIFEALLLLPLVFGAATLPKLSKCAASRDHRYFRTIAGRILLVTLSLSLFISTVVFFLGSDIFVLLDPTGRYSQAGQLIGLFIWVYPIATVSYILTVSLIAIDQQRFLAFVYCLGAFIVVVLDLLLIPTQSIYGATTALCVGLLFVTLVSAWRYRTVLYARIG